MITFSFRNWIILLLPVLIFNISSCSSDDKSEKIKEEYIKIQREKLENQLYRKYNITASLDSIYFIHSIEFQQKYLNKFLIVDFDFSINDIYLKEDKYHIVVDDSQFNLDLLISKTDYDRIFQESPYFWIHGYVAVIKISSLRKFRFEIYASKHQEADEYYCDIDIVDSEKFIGHGEIIEIKKIVE